jgi:hypothetical protein
LFETQPLVSHKEKIMAEIADGLRALLRKAATQSAAGKDTTGTRREFAAELRRLGATEAAAAFEPLTPLVAG